MMEKLTDVQVARAALLRVYQQSDLKTQLILKGCNADLRVIDDYYDLILTAYNETVWALTKTKIRALAKAIDKVMGQFCITLCVANEPISDPLGSSLEPGCNWVEAEYFEIRRKQYVLLMAVEKPSWVRCISMDLLRLRFKPASTSD